MVIDLVGESPAGKRADRDVVVNIEQASSTMVLSGQFVEHSFRELNGQL